MSHADLCRSRGGCAALMEGRAARAYGPAPPASRLLRTANAAALRPGPDPRASAGPRAANHGQARPAPARHAARPAISRTAATRPGHDQLIPYPRDQPIP